MSLFTLFYRYLIVSSSFNSITVFIIAFDKLISFSVSFIVSLYFFTPSLVPYFQVNKRSCNKINGWLEIGLVVNKLRHFYY